MKKSHRWQELEVSLKSRCLGSDAKSDETLEATILITSLMVGWIALIFWATTYFIYGEMVAAVTEAVFLPVSLGLIIAYFRSDEKPRPAYRLPARYRPQSERCPSYRRS